MNMSFNYETEKVRGITKANLLKWIADLHGELATLGVLPGEISTETHQQMMILAKLYECG